MESKFKVGDRVRIMGDSTKTEHTIKKITEGYYRLETGAFIGGIWLEKIEPTDPKTAFLSELKGLLAKYDAVINLSWNDYFDTAEAPRIDMAVQFKGSNRGISFDDVLGCSITADSIMDYDKE